MRNIRHCVYILALTAACQIAAQQPSDAAWQTDIRLGGIGGLYLLPQPGELWIDIEKSDLNRSSQPAHLRAILVGPDRTVLDEQWIADDGGAKGSPGPVQRLRLSTTVTQTGVYAVNITVTNDRYGEEIAWGFRTNSARYLVETSRGHRDAPHEEPLVLLNPNAPGDIAFLPRQGQFSIDATDFPDGVQSLTVFGPDGAEMGALEIAQGKGTRRFESPTSELRPWRLHLPKFEGQVHIDGVTRWSEVERFENFSLWTPDINSWFPLHRYRWLLTPYHLTAYAESVSNNTVQFEVHNNDTAEHIVALSLEFPEALQGGSLRPVSGHEANWAELSAREIRVPPGQSMPISIRYRIPNDGDAWLCRVRATPDTDPAMSTFSLLTLRRGAAPAYAPLAMPIVLKPYQHENARFGYLPDYPLSNQVYFDINNRPVITNKKSFHALRDGAWTDVARAARPGAEPAPFELLSSKAAFDRDNGLYLIAAQGNEAVLLHRAEGTDVPVAYPLPGGSAFDIEQFSGHNTPAGPPPFARFTLTAKDPNVFWRRLNDLHVFFPTKTPDGTLALGEPVLVSTKCIGFSGHSGMPSTLVSRDNNVHIVWAEATEPDEKVEGVPTFVATYDRKAATLSAPALVGYGPPANDVHNTPSITIDSEGYLHVLIGTHGRTFRYTRSRVPNDACRGWTDAEEIGPGLRQTYVGLVCDRDDTLHAVFRLWRTDTTYFPAGHYACLATMTKPRGGTWSEPRPLIISPFSEYSVFYHRLTIDRNAALFLSYDYWSTHWFYRTDRNGAHRALLTSPDQGATWNLAAPEDLNR